MKITKKANLALLVMLTAVSILPGCGKSKNNEQISGGVIVAPPGGVVVPTGGGCLAASSLGTTFPVTGQANIGITGFTAQTAVGGSGYTGGTYYKRVNASGDTIDLSLSGSANSVGSVSATVHLSATTLAAIGNSCVQGVYFYNTGITAGSPGSLYGGIYLMVNGGYLGL